MRLATRFSSAAVDDAPVTDGNTEEEEDASISPLPDDDQTDREFEPKLLLPTTDFQVDFLTPS
jgi:hypothetical protein